MALRLVKYDDEIPQIARVIGLSELDVTIEWWIGRYTSTWVEWKTGGEFNIETVPKNAIIKILQLTRAQRICKEDINLLKNLYKDIELI